MNGEHVWAVVEKEWTDMRKNRIIVLSMFLLPMVMVAMILGTAWWVGRLPADEGGGDLAEDLTLPPVLAALDSQDASMVILNDQFMFYLLLVPVALPVYVAAYSIIGEKETRSLEPLLATPVGTGELLLGKIIAAVAPAVVAAWLSYGLTAGGMFLIANRTVFGYLVRPVWILGMLIHGPLLGLLSAITGVIASSRMNDPRAAQQVSGLIVLPLIGVSVAVLLGRIYLDTGTLLWATLAMVLANVGALFLTVRVFQRETILTRWK